jgi:ABC-2 type transport system permease protein
MAYFKFISMSFQRSISYRVEYFMSVLNAFLYIFIFTSVWKTLIPAGKSVEGLTREDMIAYAVLSTLVKATFGRNDSLLSSRIKSGDIAADLLKPFYFPLMYLCDTIGSSLFQILSRAVPLFIFCVFVFDISLGMNAGILLKFLPLYFLSFLLFFLMSFIISTMAFYFVDIFPFWIFYYALVTLTSGAIIPVKFLPEGLQTVLYASPFPYLFYFPTMALLDKPLEFSYLELVLRYVILISVTMAASAVLYRGGIRKLTIAGG